MDNRPVRVVVPMEIRIIKTPTAPSMDGFDVRGLHAGRVYVVDDRLARYLIVADYAEVTDDSRRPIQ